MASFPSISCLLTPKSLIVTPNNFRITVYSESEPPPASGWPVISPTPFYAHLLSTISAPLFPLVCLAPLIGKNEMINTRTEKVEKPNALTIGDIF
jgi:hypothetical protein